MLSKKQIMEDIQRGWSAPIILIIASTLMVLPATAFVMFAIAFIGGLGMNAAIAFGAALQLLLTYWFAGFRLRRSGRN